MSQFASKVSKLLSVAFLIKLLKQKRYERQFREKKLIISIGSNLIDTQIGNNVYLAENVNVYKSKIGDYTYINSNSTIRYTEIGKFCSIGPNVQIVLGLHPTNLISSHPIFYANNKPFRTFSETTHIDEFKNVKIGNDVWIGEGVLIPGGIEIGNGAVVTSRAVVTKNVEPYSIVGGVPARHIKYRFDSLTASSIENTQWWDWSETLLKERQMHFLNPESFIKLFSQHSV